MLTLIVRKIVDTFEQAWADWVENPQHRVDIAPPGINSNPRAFSNFFKD